MIPHSRPDIGEAEVDAAARVLRAGMLAQGAEVAGFEAECAAFAGTRHAVAVNSGTAALHLALVVMGMGPGRTVALPSYACAALLQAVTLAGATPRLLDCAPGDDHPNANPGTPPPDATIVAHLFGARQSELPEGPILEDLAQALAPGAALARPVSIASFYATKLLTTGEGGMLLTNDAGLADEARDRRDYDNRDDWKPRFAYKMTDLQAAIGRVQLARLPQFLARRRALAAQYDAGLEDAGLAGLPLERPHAPGHLYFRYVVRTPARDALMAHLAQCGIAAKSPVYRPLHTVYGSADCAEAARAHAVNVSLPLYPSLTESQILRVLQSVQQWRWG